MNDDEVVDVELATSGQQYRNSSSNPQQRTNNPLPTTFTVKQERQDDPEITAMAAKIVENNKKTLQQQQQQQVLQQQQQQLRQQQLSASTSAGSIMNYFPKKGAAVPVVSQNGSLSANKGGPSTAADGADEKKVPADDESHVGHFGWQTYGKAIHIPFILRSGERYCAVRIVEVKVLHKYLNFLHQDIYSCTCVRSYYITEMEARLLNEINQKHCENQFGRDLFTQKDLVVRLSDVNKFWNFLDVCYRKLSSSSATLSVAAAGGSQMEKCGFIRINKESVVPYTVSIVV